MTSSVFEMFLAPCPVHQFLGAVYGKTPLHIEGQKGRFASLLPWDALNELLFQQRIEFPRINLAKEGSALDVNSYVKMMGTVPQLDLKALNGQFREGAMLVLNAIDELYQPIREMCRMVEQQLCNHIQANAYAGWHTTQGFSTHWDDHDVFIVQVSGRKHWRVYEPQRKHPVITDKSAKLTPPKETWWEGDLLDGHVLYIPRGWWHDALPLGEPTLHLTFSIRRPSGIDFAQSVIEKLHDNELARADLPRFAPPIERQEYFSKLQDAIIALVRESDMDAYFREADLNAPGRLRPSFPWSAMPECQSVSATDWLHWQAPRVVPIGRNGNYVVLEALGQTFTFEEFVEPVLRNLADNGRMRFDQLCARHPNLEPEELGAFAIELVSSGLVAISTGAAI